MRTDMIMLLGIVIIVYLWILEIHILCMRDKIDELEKLAAKIDAAMPNPRDHK